MICPHSAVNYLNIIAHASDAFLAAHTSESNSRWVKEFASSRTDTNRKSYQMATILALASASVQNNQPLPPHLSTPHDALLSEKMVESRAADLLHLSNLNEPGFRALSTVEVAYAGLLDTVDNILKNVRVLVGEVDFSYDIIATPAGGSGVLAEADVDMEVKAD